MWSSRAYVQNLSKNETCGLNCKIYEKCKYMRNLDLFVKHNEKLENMEVWGFIFKNCKINVKSKRLEGLVNCTSYEKLCRRKCLPSNVLKIGMGEINMKQEENRDYSNWYKGILVIM